MDISIQQVTNQGFESWQVEVFGVTVSFKDRASALAFAVKLQERVDAPHQLSEETLRRWEAEHASLQADG